MYLVRQIMQMIDGVQGSCAQKFATACGNKRPASLPRVRLEGRASDFFFLRTFSVKMQLATATR